MEITSGGTYTVDSFNQTITINTTAAIVLQGDGTALEEVQIVVEADTADLTINNLNITNESSSVIQFGDGAGNILTVNGTNVFEVSAGTQAAVNVGGGLTAGGGGSLKATTLTGAAIGVNRNENRGTSNIMINSGTFDLTARRACAIIGVG